MATKPLTNDRHDAETRRTILHHLKMNGAKTASAMAREFGLTAMAVRLHLYDLEKQGVVSARSEAKGRGRPSKFWHLTEKADAAFPDSHRDLAVELLGAARDAFGDDGVAKLVENRGRAQKERYGTVLRRQKTLPGKLKALAKLRTDEGYMAEAHKAEGSKNDWLFIENHCPICTVAKDCTGLCVNELEVFQDVLGTDYSVSRAEHIVSGDRRCAYRISRK